MKLLFDSETWKVSNQRRLSLWRRQRTLGSPSVKVGDAKVGGMHFPDLIIRANERDPEAIYIEIKVRARGRKASHQACLADVKKLAKEHDPQ
jgi:hypothetical protein